MGLSTALADAGCLSATQAASGVNAQPRPASINRLRLATASVNSLDLTVRYNRPWSPVVANTRDKPDLPRVVGTQPV